MSKLTASIHVGKTLEINGNLAATIKIIDEDGSEKMSIACDKVMIVLPDHLVGIEEYEYPLQNAIKSHHAITTLKRTMY